MTKIRVGDWVVHPESEHPWRISDNSLIHLDNTELQHWRPKEGNLFWGPRKLMWDYMYKTRIELLQLKKIHSDGTYSLISPLDENVYSYYIDPSEIKGFLSQCEPFTGELPTFLKDKK